MKRLKFSSAFLLALIPLFASAKQINVPDWLADRLGSREAMYACASVDKDPFTSGYTFTNALDATWYNSGKAWSCSKDTSLIFKIPDSVTEGELPVLNSYRLVRDNSNSTWRPEECMLAVRNSDEDEWTLVDVTTGIMLPAVNNQGILRTSHTCDLETPVKARQYKFTLTAGTNDGASLDALLFIADDSTAPAVTFVTPNGTGDGTGWATATDLATALANVGQGGEIWMQEGVYTMTAGITATKFCSMIGGFAGDEATKGARHGTGLSVLDGTAVTDPAALILTDTAPGKWIFENVAISNTYWRGMKLGTSYLDNFCSLYCKNCHFYNTSARTDSTNCDRNGLGVKAYGGHGLNVEFDGCRFEGIQIHYDNTYFPGNGNAGVGIWDEYGDLILRNTTIINCGLEHGKHGFSAGRDVSSYGFAVYIGNGNLYATNSVVTGCRAISNGGDGGIVTFYGNEFDKRLSKIINCRFIANDYTPYYSGAGSSGGTLYVRTSTASPVIDIDRTTFAYNAGPKSGALRLTGGTVSVRNSIIYGNLYNTDLAGAADICIDHATASLDMDYSLMTGDDSTLTYIRAESGAYTLGSHMQYGDPQFTTPLSTILSSITLYDGGHPTYPNIGARSYYAKSFDFESVDVHCADKVSLAVDTGDPAADVGSEPMPNGNRLNLGAYAGTPEAAISSSATIEITASTIDFTDDYTKPHVSLTVKDSEDPYQATVYFCYGNAKSISSGTEGWQYVDKLTETLEPGQTLDSFAHRYLEKDSTVFWRIVVKTPSQSVSLDGPDGGIVVNGTQHPLWGVGLGAGYIHVKGNATGCGDGSDWLNAAVTYADALKLITADHTNVVLATSVEIPAGGAIGIDLPFRVLGGFAGDEDDFADRPVSGLSIVDGSGEDLLSTHTVASGVTVFERVQFQDIKSRAIAKTGAGALELNGCRFVKCGLLTSDCHGRAVYVNGATDVRISDCDIEACVCPTDPGYRGISTTVYLNGVGNAVIDGSTFASNGVKHVTSYNMAHCRDGFMATVRVIDTPVSFTNCRFFNNCWSRAWGGRGVVSVFGTSPAAFTNCLFTANYGETYNGNKIEDWQNGTVYIELNSAATPVVFERCTIAYNYSDSGRVAGVVIARGTATIKDSILYGNMINPGWYSIEGLKAGTDLYVTKGETLLDSVSDSSSHGSSDATANIVYSLFTSADSPSVLGSNKVDNAELITFGNGVIEGDPKFIDTLTVFTNGFTKTGTAGSYYYFAKNPLRRPNVHVNGRKGYLDEFTGVQVPGAKANGESPAIDAGDPREDCCLEPGTGFRSRLNLGYYGNTPYATGCYAPPGFMLILK